MPKRKTQPIGLTPGEFERRREQASYDLEDGGAVGNPGRSLADTRACLAAVRHDTPHMTPFRWRVREVFLWHVLKPRTCPPKLKPKKRQPLPSTSAVVEYLCCTVEDIEAALAWLRTEGAWTAYVAPVRDVRKLRKQPAPSRAEAVLNQRAMLEAGHPEGTTLDSLTADEIDALFPIVERLRESCTRVCQGCHVPMLDSAFDSQRKNCSAACKQKAYEARQR